MRCELYPEVLLQPGEQLEDITQQEIDQRLYSR